MATGGKTEYGFVRDEMAGVDEEWGVADMSRSSQPVVVPIGTQTLEMAQMHEMAPIHEIGGTRSTTEDTK